MLYMLATHRLRYMLSYIHTMYCIYILNILYLHETLNLIDMKCQCGSGYCPVDNVTYPCECEEISVQEIQELKALVEEDYEEDDLPF